MKKFIQNNWLFFACLGLFILAGGTYLAYIEKPEAILFFNENRSDWLNIFFSYVTKLGEELMYVLIVIAFLFVRVRHSILVAVTGLVVMGVSYALKSFFAIDRPKAFFKKNGMLDQIDFVPGVDLHAGATSFPSGHSMSAFALYGLLILILPNRKRYALPLFLIASLVAVSRVYLVQHFWEDIYVGSLIGVVLAMIFYAVDLRFKEVLDKPLIGNKNFQAKQVS